MRTDMKKIFTLVAVCAMALPVLTGCDKEMTDEEIGQAYERYLNGTEAPDEFGEKGALIWLVRHEIPTDQLTK